MNISGNLFIGSIAVALAVGGFTGAVAFSKPGRIEYKDREVLKYRDKESATTALAVNRIEGPKTKIMWREKTVTEPGGTVYVDRWHEKLIEGPTITKQEEQTVLIREVAVDRIKEVTKIETRLPTWSVSLQGGYAANDPLIALPGLRRSVLGFSVERQILGPVNAGAWFNSTGAAGLSVGVRW